MNRIHADLPINTFRIPDDVVTVNICKTSGQAAVPGVCSSRSEKFAVGTQPQEYCSIHGSGAPVEIQQQQTSDLAPGAITIYNSDQTTIFPDVLEDLGVENTPENQENLEDIPDIDAPEYEFNEDDGEIVTIPGDENADIWSDDDSANDQLTQEQIEILNGIPEALP